MQTITAIISETDWRKPTGANYSRTWFNFRVPSSFSTEATCPFSTTSTAPAEQRAPLGQLSRRLNEDLLPPHYAEARIKIDARLEGRDTGCK
jgi:hypothetical protein